MKLKGTEILLKVLEEEKVDIIGKVVYTNGSKNNFVMGMGIQFVEISDIVKIELEKYVKKHKIVIDNKMPFLGVNS